MAQSYPSHPSAAEARARDSEDTFRELRQKAGAVADEGAKAIEAAGEKAEHAFAATKRFVQDQPYVAIGAVIVAGCALGALWKLNAGRRDPALLDRLSDYVEPGYRALRRRL
jgi:ElaB/YqjD/DUF883 family membrane-anchored ribosome-binding protein